MQIYGKHPSTGFGNDRRCGSNYKVALPQIGAEFDGISNHYIGSPTLTTYFPSTLVTVRQTHAKANPSLALAARRQRAWTTDNWPLVSGEINS
jgi:hypothetical protein